MKKPLLLTGPGDVPETVRRVCDVYPGSRDVERVEIVMRKAGGAEELGGDYWRATMNLSQKARDRYRRFLARGCTPPRAEPRQPQADSDET